MNTRAVIVNTPHNPTGVVYSEDTIKELCLRFLRKKQQEFGSVIYLISDEPYRELAYDGVKVPYLTKYYKNTVVGYSTVNHSSLPGGVLVIWSSRMNWKTVQQSSQQQRSQKSYAWKRQCPVPDAESHPEMRGRRGRCGCL